MLEDFTVDPVSKNFEPSWENCGEEGNLIFSAEPRDESRITSVSIKLFLVTGFIGSMYYSFSTGVFESQLSHFKKFYLTSVLLYYNGNWFKVFCFSS